MAHKHIWTLANYTFQIGSDYALWLCVCGARKVNLSDDSDEGAGDTPIIKKPAPNPKAKGK